MPKQTDSNSRDIKLAARWRLRKPELPSGFEDRDFEFSGILPCGSEALSWVGPFLLRFSLADGATIARHDVRTLSPTADTRASALCASQVGWAGVIFAHGKRPVVWWPSAGGMTELGRHENARVTADGDRVLIARPGAIDVHWPREGKKRAHPVPTLMYGGVSPRLFGDTLVLDTSDGKEERTLLGLELTDINVRWQTKLERRCPHWITPPGSAFSLLRGREDRVYMLDVTDGVLQELRIPSGPGQASGLVLGETLVTPIPRLAGQQKEWDLGVYQLPGGKQLTRIPLASQWPESVLRLDDKRVVVTGLGVEVVDVKRELAISVLGAKKIAHSALVAGPRQLIVTQGDEIVCFELPGK